MHERTLVSVKVERCSAYRLSSALFILPLFYLRDYNQFMRVNARSQKRVSGKSTLSHSPTLFFCTRDQKTKAGTLSSPVGMTTYL